MQNARENALQRQENGGRAILYTIVLWFGMEFYGVVVFGFVLGFLELDGVWMVLMYIGALGCAGLGGYIAILVSRIKMPVDLFATPKYAVDNDEKEIA